MWRMSEQSGCGEYLMGYLFAFGKKNFFMCLFCIDIM